MAVTIDIKMLLIVLLLIALIVLIVFAIMVLRKLLVTLDETNKVLEDMGEISEIAAARSQDIDEIIDHVSETCSDISSSRDTSNFVSTAVSVAKSVSSIRGMAGREDAETRAAKRKENIDDRNSKRRMR
jgi:uncharacterized protein YoxC